ncbi:MAG: starvation-sensing protein RspA [Acidobacteria bacterium]|nr:starvation-sensing protein RspA [Acidobacteriota bacterium]
MKRRSLLQALPLMPAAAADVYAQRTRGLPPLTIKDVKVIATAAGGRYEWVFVKVITSEPGLYGLGSASNAYQSLSVVTAIEKYLAPFWTGKNPDRIEQLWQLSHVRSVWRNSTIINNAISGLDMALWDIKGKRAGMPVYELLGGKTRDAVALYAHADGRDIQQVTENVQKFVGEGFRHVRAQLGGYGGGGWIPGGEGSRPEGGPKERVFDEDLYADAVPRLFEHLRGKVQPTVKLLHDVHERLTPTTAVEFARRMEPYRLFFLEDLLPPEQIDWFRQVKQVTTTPLAIGEVFTSPHEYVPLISERLIDFVRCRVSQIGGITQARKIATLSEFFGGRTAWQEGGDNDPVNQLAAYHVDLSISSFGIQEENHFPPLVHEMMPGTAQIRGGYLYGNDAPGLGIDINEAMAAKYPLHARPGADDWTTIHAMDGSIIKP